MCPRGGRPQSRVPIRQALPEPLAAGFDLVWLSGGLERFLRCSHDEDVLVLAVRCTVNKYSYIAVRLRLAHARNLAPDLQIKGTLSCSLFSLDASLGRELDPL